jgi:hypothetical protein
MTWKTSLMKSDDTRAWNKSDILLTKMSLGVDQKWGMSKAVRGHEKVPTGGQVRVPFLAR